MLAARFQFNGTTDQLLAHIGNISTLPGIEYWSVTRQRWRPLITRAFALNSADKTIKRDDFKLSEMKSGDSLYLFQKEETPAGEVIYKLDATVSDNSILISTSNTQPISRFGITLFDVGEYQTAYQIERDSEDSWRFYLVTRVGKAPHPLVSGHQASYINRANALYRHISGIRTNSEPPLAPVEPGKTP